MTPLVSDLVLRGLLPGLADRIGLPGLHECFDQADLPLDLPPVQILMLPQPRLLAFYGACERRLRTKSLMLDIADVLSVEDWGPTGRYLLEAPSLGALLDRLVSGARLHMPCERVALSREGDAIVLGCASPVRNARAYEHYSTAAALLLMQVISPHVGAARDRLHVQFDTDRAAWSGALEQALGCDIGFGAAEMRVVIPIELLGDDRSGRVLQDAAPPVLGDEPADVGPATLAVRHAIRCVLARGEPPSLPHVAAHLMVGERTLKRRLAHENSSFSEQREAVRFAEARAHIAKGESSVTEIAARIGYSCSGHFIRAFRALHGVTPTAWRAERASRRAGPDPSPPAL